MDFMKLLKSLDELLYELVSWLLFYPVTMWRSLTAPLRMMRYADTELADRPEDQYEDTLSPPLFLLLTLLLSQAFSSAIPSVIDPSAAVKQLGSASNLLIARGVIFGIFPLCMAGTILRWKAVKMTRNALRPPFFSQCYVAAPFVFMLVLGIDLIGVPEEKGMTAGMLAMGVALTWYIQAQVRWFMHDLGAGVLKALIAVILAMLVAVVSALLVAVAITMTAKDIAPQ